MSTTGILPPCAPVERAIGLLKHWKILTDGYRGRLSELPNRIHMIVNLEFYRLAY